MVQGLECRSSITSRGVDQKMEQRWDWVELMPIELDGVSAGGELWNGYLTRLYILVMSLQGAG